MIIGPVLVLLCLTTPLYSLSTTTTGSSFTRYQQFINTLTTVVNGNQRAVHSSGGAAGGVVSEGQGYGLLIGALTANAIGSSNPNYRTVISQTFEMYNGWKRMCFLSIGSGSCQSPGYCPGGIPCLPHWKFDDNLNSPWGTGSATDGDADAITGLIILVRLTESAKASYPLWNEAAEFAYQSCKQFFDDETATSGSHRATKLGACWGGWDCQNPSYLAPAMYRICRNYMSQFSSKLSHGTEGSTYVNGWNTLISTTYQILQGAQAATGLTPNWYVPNSGTPSLRGSTACSGSGTPAAQFGAEASRGIWRVALDCELFPTEAGAQCGPYLDKVNGHLISKFSNGNFGNLDTGDLVTSVFPNWQNEQFMFGPTFCALVRQKSGATNQQTVLNSAGQKIASSSITSYYGGSWIAIATLTLSGDAAKAASLVQGAPTAPTPAPAPTQPPPTAAPTRAPPTAAPTRPPPTAAPAPTACTKTKIFSSGTFNSNPQFDGSYSWGTYSLSNPAKKYRGFNTLSLLLQSFNAIQIRCTNGQNCIKTSQYKGVEFYVASNSGQSNFRVRMRKMDGEVGSNSIQTATTTWTKKQVYFSAIAPGVTEMNVLQFQDNGQYNTIFIDEVYLLGNSC